MAIAKHRREICALRVEIQANQFTPFELNRCLVLLYSPGTTLVGNCTPIVNCKLNKFLIRPPGGYGHLEEIRDENDEVDA